MDKYYGNVCELDIIFSFTKAYYILDELLLAGELQESSKKNVLRCISQQDSLEDMEVSLFPYVLSARWNTSPVTGHLNHSRHGDSPFDPHSSLTRPSHLARSRTKSPRSCRYDDGARDMW